MYTMDQIVTARCPGEWEFCRLDGSLAQAVLYSADGVRFACHHRLADGTRGEEAWVVDLSQQCRAGRDWLYKPRGMFAFEDNHLLLLVEEDKQWT